MDVSPALPPTESSFARLLRLESAFVRSHRLPIVLALAGMLLQSVLILPIPLLQGWVLDQLVVRDGAHDGPDGVCWAIAAAFVASVLCYVARMALGWKGNTVMTRVSLEVVRELTDALHRKLQRLPMTYFDGRQTGRLMARLTGDVGSLLVFLNSGSLQLGSDLVLAVGIAGVVLWLNWQLALIGFLALPLYALVHRLFAARLHRISRAAQSEVAAIYGLLSERVSAVRVVRAFAQEDDEVAAFDRRLDAHREVGRAGNRAGTSQGALATLISGIGTVGVVAVGALLVGRGSLTVGGLLAFYALIAQLYNPIVRLTQFHATVSATLISADRLLEILDEPETGNDHPDALPVRRPRGALSFRDVSFAYRPDGPLVLDRVSLEIQAGMTVGILGPSGAGKSTLLALAPRLYEVPEGQGAIRLDGRNVRGLRLADLRRAIALVAQQAMLFEGTVHSNLTYANPKASAAAIRRALEAVDLAATVDAMAQGLKTPVGERGFSLSGGQRQRLALARALLADPTVLLLDDCTSALDAETEANVRASLEELLPGRTCVIVSHKIASVRRADQIFVLEAGRVVERGSHDELLTQGGLYAETAALQQGVPSAL